MTSRGLPPLLALEIPEPGRPATNRCGSTGADQSNEHENTLWGAPRIHGELLKLGFAVAQSTVATTWPAQTPARLVRAGAASCANHLPQIAAMDLFVVPTIGFNLLYVLIIVRLARREPHT